MDVLGAIVGVALLSNNLHALVAIVLALRQPDATRARELGRRCAYLTLGSTALYVVLYAVVFLTAPWPAQMSRFDHARVTSNFIAECMYAGAFLLGAVFIPVLATAWLLRRRLSQRP